MRPTTQKKDPLDVKKEKEVFLEAQRDLVDTNQPSTSGHVRAIPERFEQLIRKSPMKKVSKVKYIFKSCLPLIHDKDDVMELIALIEEKSEDLRPDKRVNHIGRKVKTDRELGMTV